VLRDKVVGVFYFSPLRLRNGMRFTIRQGFRLLISVLACFWKNKQSFACGFWFLLELLKKSFIDVVAFYQLPHRKGNSIAVIRLESIDLFKKTRTHCVNRVRATKFNPWKRLASNYFIEPSSACDVRGIPDVQF
jgi:hypothetical protein